MFDSKVESKIGRNKSYNIYFVIEFFRALFGVALFTFAGFVVILFSPVILLMTIGSSIEYPLFDLVGPFVLIALVCFVSLYALLGVEKLLFSKATIREFKNRMMTVRPTQAESRKEEHDTGPEQKTYSFPAFDRKKLYDVMQKRLTNVSSCRDRVQMIHEYLEEQGAFEDIMASDSDYRLPEITSQDFPKGILPNRTKKVMLEALWHLNRGSEEQYWKEVEDMILHPFPEFPVTPVELQIFHILYQVGNCVDWKGIKNSEKFSL